MLCYVIYICKKCGVLSSRYTCVCNACNCLYIYMYTYVHILCTCYVSTYTRAHTHTNLYNLMYIDIYTCPSGHEQVYVHRPCADGLYLLRANFFTFCSPWERRTGSSLAQESRIRFISKSDSQATYVFKTALFWPMSTKVQGPFPYL